MEQVIFYHVKVDNRLTQMNNRKSIGLSKKQKEKYEIKKLIKVINGSLEITYHFFLMGNLSTHLQLQRHGLEVSSIKNFPQYLQTTILNQHLLSIGKASHQTRECKHCLTCHTNLEI